MISTYVATNIIGNFQPTYSPPQLFKLLLGLAVHFPLPGVFRGALLLQELQQPLQAIWTKPATQASQASFKNYSLFIFFRPCTARPKEKAATYPA